MVIGSFLLGLVASAILFMPLAAILGIHDTDSLIWFATSVIIATICACSSWIVKSIKKPDEYISENEDLGGDVENRNKGIGLQMVNSVLEIAFKTLNLHRVDLGVFDFNKAAISCYEKAGFIIEGKFRECRKINGQYWSLINMSILQNQYFNIKLCEVEAPLNKV